VSNFASFKLAIGPPDHPAFVTTDAADFPAFEAAFCSANDASNATADGATQW
jgi:hypothetical protein